MIKVISFDIGNTLVQKTSTKSVRERILELSDVDYVVAKHAYVNHFITRKISFEEFCVQTKIQNAKEIERIIDEYYQKNSKRILFDDVYDTLLELYRLGFKLISISNKSYKNPFRLKEFGIDQFFLKEIYSHEVGIKKPNIAIFQYAQQCIRAKSEEFLHVGDAFCSDYIAAKDASWHSILLTRGEDSRRKYRRDKTIHSINRLNELISYVKTIK